jgi:GTP-binding protein LepA
VREGTLARGDTIRLMHTGADHDVEEVGLLQLKHFPVERLEAGAVGYVIAGIKTIRDIEIGDTVTHAERPAAGPLPGYKPAKPVVFSSLYPMSTDDYQDLGKALDKLALNDAALTWTKDSSAALGFGFRCGFLGLLHLDVVQERLRREFDLDLLLSAPTVQYRVRLEDGSEQVIDNPALWPDPTLISKTWEPFIRATMYVPERHVGQVMELCRERRGENMQARFLAVGRVEVSAELPLAEVLFDFYDKLKTVTQGYGSFDYDLLDDRPTDLVKVDVLVNGEPVDALSQLVHRDKARPRALHYCERLAETIPRQQFKIAIQGAVGGSIVARTTINAFRKDVTAKCYGGDITRKRKLLEKQREGKKRMKLVGAVEIPQEAFVAVLKSEIGS